jgi:hypothetical protein
VNVEDAEEWTQSIGQTTAGNWRQIRLATKLGVPQLLGMTVEQWTEERLGGYVRQSIPERREAVAELKEEGLSNREAWQRHAFVKLGMFRGQAVLCMRLVPTNPDVRDVLIFEGKRLGGWQRWTLDRLRTYFAEWARSAETKLL